MKITDYEKAQVLNSSNMFLIDGSAGTKTILAPDAANELAKMADVHNLKVMDTYGIVGTPRKDVPLDDMIDELADRSKTLDGADKEIEAIVNRYGSKNILQNTGVTQVSAGITYTVYPDGHVLANGTCNNANGSWFIIKSNYGLPAGSYIFSLGNQIPTAYCEAYIRRPNDSNICAIISSDADGEKEFTLDADVSDVNSVFLYVAEGGVLDNYVFYPMIRDARIKDGTYVPYAMTNKALTDSVAQLNSAIAVQKPIVTIATFLSGAAYAFKCGNVAIIVAELTPTSAVSGHGANLMWNIPTPLINDTTYCSIVAKNGKVIPCVIQKDATYDYGVLTTYYGAGDWDDRADFTIAYPCK